MPKVEKKKRRDKSRHDAAPYEEGEVEEVEMKEAPVLAAGHDGDDDRNNNNEKKSRRRSKDDRDRSDGNDRNKKSKNQHRHRTGRSIDHNDDTSPCATFDEMNLKPDLLKGIYAYGFEKPSAIQQRAIRPIVRGRDVIAQSQSGTGKTAVFSIASLQLLDSSSRNVQVLVLSPTRELAEQSQRVMQSLGDFMNVSLYRVWNKNIQ
jgi:superfamily II RNA helicase